MPFPLGDARLFDADRSRFTSPRGEELNVGTYGYGVVSGKVSRERFSAGDIYLAGRLGRSLSMIYGPRNNVEINDTLTSKRGSNVSRNQTRSYISDRFSPIISFGNREGRIFVDNS